MADELELGLCFMTWLTEAVVGEPRLSKLHLVSSVKQPRLQTCGKSIPESKAKYWGTCQITACVLCIDVLLSKHHCRTKGTVTLGGVCTRTWIRWVFFMGCHYLDIMIYYYAQKNQKVNRHHCVSNVS